MAFACEHCHKGVAHGHAVSHAKNRLKRLFKPNLQKLIAVKKGVLQRVKLCTSCIKRLRRDGKLGAFSLRKAVVKAETKVKLKLPKKIEEAPQKKTDSVAEALQIEEIVGKKS